MTDITTETLPRTEGLRRDEMKEPDEVSAMLRLKALGWGSRRISAELGCSRTTVRRWLEQGEWRRPAPVSRAKGLDGLEAWVEERFRRHAGNADVVRQELAAEKGVAVSLRTVERAVAHLRRELRAEARATVRFGVRAWSAQPMRSSSGRSQTPNAWPAAADRLRPAARRDRRHAAAGVVLRGDPGLFTPPACAGLCRRAAGALVRGNGERLRGVRGRDRGGAARQRACADPEPRRGQP